MNIDIEKKLAEIEKNLALKDAIARTLEASKVNKKITMEQITEIESISPGILTDTIQDLRDSKVTMEELTLLHKGLLGAGLFAIIALIMKLFGGSGGGSGGGGGSSSGLAKSVKEGNKVAEQTITQAEQLEEDLTDKDVDDMVDRFTAWLDNEVDEIEAMETEEAKADAVATPSTAIVNELYETIIEAEGAVVSTDAIQVPKAKKVEKIKNEKDIRQQLYAASYRRSIRLAPFEIVWNSKSRTLNFLCNSLLDKYGYAGHDSNMRAMPGGPGNQFIINLTDYIQKVNTVFQHLDDNFIKIEELFKRGYGNGPEEHPLLKLPPSYVNYMVNHGAGDDAIYKGEIQYYNEVWHGSVKLIEYLKAQMTINVSPETLAVLNTTGFSGFSSRISEIRGSLGSAVMALDSIRYDLTDPDLEDSIKNIERIYEQYSGHRYFPTGLKSLYRDFKDVNKFTKNILTVMVMVTGIYTKVNRAMYKYSEMLGKQDRLVERLQKYSANEE